METVTSSAFKKNMEDSIQNIVETHRPMFVKGRKRSTVVVISLEDYRSLTETRYLLSSPANAERLMLGIAEIENVIKSQRDFFQTGKSKKIEFRILQLNKLLKAVKEHESEIINSLSLDLGRHHIDSYLGDIAPLEKSIKFQISFFYDW